MNEIDRIIHNAESEFRRRKRKQKHRAEPKDETPISQEFRDAICDGGTPVADCDFCGRTYFASDDGYFDPGELDDLKAKQQVKPDNYIQVEDQSVSVGQIDGKTFVWQCDKCEVVKRIERWVINHRWTLCRFLKSRAKEIAADAEMELSLVKELDPK